MTNEEFINREVATWGEDYIFDLLDKGFTPTLLLSHTGEVKWTWRLTSGASCDRLSTGGTPTFLPFRRFARV